MKDYFYILLAVSVCSSLCICISGKGFEKYIRYVASLVCVCAVLLPLKNILAELFADNEYLPEVSFECSGGRLEDAYAEGVAEYISEAITENLGIKPLSVSINIERTENEYLVTAITVTVSADDAGYARGVKDYLSENFGGEVKVLNG